MKRRSGSWQSWTPARKASASLSGSSRGRAAPLRSMSNASPPAPYRRNPLRRKTFPDFRFSEVKTSEKQKSRLPVIGSADFRKSDTSYIESNQTDLSQLYPSIHPSATVPESRWIDRSECRREVQEAIEFPLLCQQFGYEDVESVTELIVDTLCSTRPTFRIGGAEMPAEQVKGRLQMLDNGHLEYVFDCMRRNTTEIRNIRAYLLTALYNAPVTMSPYYQAAVQHDFSYPQWE